MKKFYWLLLFVLLISWGSNYTVVKIGLSYSSPLIFSMLRMLLGGIGTIPLVLYSYRSSKGKLARPKGAKALGITALFAILSSVLFYGLWFSAETTIDPSTIAVVIYTNPLFIVLFAALFLSEPITRMKAAGIVLGFIGAFLVLTRGNLAGISASAYNFALLFTAAISYGGSMIVYKKWLTNYNYYFVNFLQLLIGAVILFIWAALADFSSFFATGLANPSFILALLYLVVLGTIISNIIWLLLLDKQGPSWYASWTFLIPVFAIIVAFAVLGVGIVPVQMGGVALVVLGLYIVNRQHAAPSSIRNTSKDKKVEGIGS